MKHLEDKRSLEGHFSGTHSQLEEDRGQRNLHENITGTQSANSTLRKTTKLNNQL
jgi:hypothetical protein